VTFVIKAAVTDPAARAFAFRAQKTMDGGKGIAEGDPIRRTALARRRLGRTERRFF
jgi:hypothetical protein